MAERWVLDTNVYIQALRDRERLAALKRFRLRAGERLLVSAVVALELRAGALTADHVTAVETILTLYGDRDRVVVPSFDAYVQTGRVLAALATKERMPVATAPRSFTNDVLLAVSCRDADVTLITGNIGNVGDFTTIRRHLRGFRFETAVPG
jgi:predicted nucleic acid-binding protein